MKNYVTEYPEEKEHSLYNKVRTNIKNACFRLQIEIDTTWDGAIIINY